jgi:hypothetical protein
MVTVERAQTAGFSRTEKAKVVSRLKSQLTYTM